MIKSIKRYLPLINIAFTLVAFNTLPAFGYSPLMQAGNPHSLLLALKTYSHFASATALTSIILLLMNAALLKSDTKLNPSKGIRFAPTLSVISYCTIAALFLLTCSYLYAINSYQNMLLANQDAPLPRSLTLCESILDVILLSSFCLLIVLSIVAGKMRRDGNPPSDNTNS